MPGATALFPPPPPLHPPRPQPRHPPRRRPPPRHSRTSSPASSRPPPTPSLSARSPASCRSSPPRYSLSSCFYGALPASSPLPAPHALSSLATSLPDLPTSVPLLVSSSPQPLPLPYYALLLSISAHAGLFPVSLAVLRHMRSFGLASDAACFHSALRAAGLPGDVSAVLGIVSASGVSSTVPLVVTAVHKLIDKMPEFGCVPNVVVCTAMLDGKCGFGDACYWLGVMEENGVLCDSDVYAGLLLGLCEEGHVLGASALGRKVVERGIRIEASCADRLVVLLKQHGHMVARS